MDSQEAEDVVRLVFGDHPPENWRENPEFVQYLTELGNLGADRLAVEPESINHQLKSVQSSTQELAFSNYKTFIQTSNCSKQIYTQLTSTEEHLGNLTEQMPDFLQKCDQFKLKAAEISTHRKMTSLTLSKHTQLLEILELPQLMDTVVRNQHYDEALELHSYVTKLWRKQSDVKILQDIHTNVNNSVKLMLHQLLAQLRTSIQLPQCLKVISYLRRLEIFTENELRLKFLQARETWLHSVINAVPRDDAYIHLTRTMEVMRVHLFDIVTQYRAIFSDDSFTIEQDKQHIECNNRLLFSSWLSRKVEEFIKILEQDLEQTSGSIETLLGQAMYFGLSFSRVGFDFRPVLVPVFERMMMKQLGKQVNFDSNSKVISDSFLCLNLAKVAGLKHSLHHDQEDVSQPPMLLLEYPPLAQACNIILTGLNTVRLCAPISCVHTVTSTLQTFLASIAQHILQHHRNNHAAWSTIQLEGFHKLCSVFNSILLPYLQASLSAVFSPQHMSEISGLSISDLRSQRLGYLEYSAICAPIQDFITVEKDLAETSPNCNDKVEEEGGTSYVAERMAELSLAVEGDSSQQQDVARSSSLNGEAILDIDTKTNDAETSSPGNETTTENSDQATINENITESDIQQSIDHATTNENITEQTIEASEPVANIEIITTAATPVKNEGEETVDDEQQIVSVEGATQESSK